MKRLLVIILGLAAIATTGAVFDLTYLNRIYPNVAVAGVDVGGLTFDQAQAKLQSQLPQSPLRLRWGTADWTINHEQLGLEYDLKSTVNRAFGLGRRSSLWVNWSEKLKLLAKRQKFLGFDFYWQENLVMESIAGIASQINIPTREPSVQLVDGAVQVLNGQPGQMVDEIKLIAAIEASIASLSPQVINIPIINLNSHLAPPQIQQLQNRAQNLIGKKLTLNLNGQVWEITNEEMFAWLDIDGWKMGYIELWVSQLADSIDRPAQNALFRYINPGRVEEFRPAQDGLTVEQRQLANIIAAKLSQLESVSEVSPVSIPLVHTVPAIKNADVNRLGINELLAVGKSNFSGSIPNRIFNIKKAAANFNGLLIAPGETFSFNQHVGDISAEGGYKPAYIIKDGRTVLGDGGGVCQVSTTAFRAALNAGLPIVERNAHTYRVHYYEQDSQPGFDATIFTPSVDLKFSNDTPGHILIQTKVDEVNKTLVFELYGTSDGRQISLTKAQVWDVIPPPPDLYIDDPTLAPGEVRQVDWKAWGAKASFNYKVTRGDEILQDRTFYSNFRPWQAVFLRGVAT